MDPHIYFIQCRNFVKIGVSHVPDARLDDLQVGNPYELKLIGYIPNGGFEEEREIQTRFNNLRIRGEWFALEDGLKEFIKKHAKKWKFRIYEIN